MNLCHQRLSPQQRQQRSLILGLTATPIFGSFICAYGPYSSPFFCPFRALTGIPCPGCGLTRSFTAIALGQWQTAVDFHLFGPLLFLSLLVATTHCGLELIRDQQQSGFYLNWVRQPRIQLVSAFLVFGYHLFRLEQLNQTGELALNFQNSPLGWWLFSGKL